MSALTMRLAYCTVLGAVFCISVLASLLSDAAQASENNGALMPFPEVARGDVAASDVAHESGVSKNLLTISPWRFEMSYGVSSSEMSYPSWKTVSGKSVANEESSVGVISDLRVNHSFELPLSRSQSVRAGVSLSKVQSAAAFGMGETLAPASRIPVWRTWGFGADVFMVRRLSPGLEIDAGVVGDYLVGGFAEISGAAGNSLIQSRLEQKSGWRLGFCGGVGGLYAGPIGLVVRLGSYWNNLSYREHPKPIQAQGAQISLGFVINLARGDW